MLKHLKIYYLFVSLPFLMLICGAAIFWGPIMSTLDRNPHPQINITIFGIIIIGGLLVIYNSTRLMREAKVLREFSRALHAKTDSTTLKQMANSYNCEIACLLQMIANSSDRSISHQEQAALEHEVANVHSRLNKRNSLPSYLTGLLVGMGLLGTFIGLLATLGDIGALIGSFSDLDMSAADPIVVFSSMIEKMKAPMASMAIAFSASMFGLLGSIVMGLMMVGIRRFQGDINSVLSSETARHVEIALSYESISFRGGDAVIGCYEQPTDLVSKVLLRIEERLAEAARIRQRALSTEIDDFKSQRADMLQALTEQTEANNKFQQQLQLLGNQLGTIFSGMEQRDKDISVQLSEFSVGIAARAKEVQKLLSVQVEQQSQLSGQLDSYKIDEHLSEWSRSQQRALQAVADDFKQQRDEMRQTIAEQAEASRNFRNELKKIGTQLSAFLDCLDKGNNEISSQISELRVNASADAKEGHRMLNVVGNNLFGELQQLGELLEAQFTQLESTVSRESGEFCVRLSELKNRLSENGEKTEETIDAAGNKLHEELLQLGRQLVALSEAIEKGGGNITRQIAEMMQNRSSDARESQELLEQMLRHVSGFQSGEQEGSSAS